MSSDPQPILTKWTDEMILDLIRKVRNDLIKDFLDERYLREYAEQKFGIRDLALLRIEFVKAALREMLISPVDRVHYSRLMHQIRETDSASLSEGNDELFFRDVEKVLKRHIF